jgi:hypothetical protein
MQCILHDLDFNPENDKQAEDRCHRLVAALLFYDTSHRHNLSVTKYDIKLNCITVLCEYSKSSGRNCCSECNYSSSANSAIHR